VSFVSKKTRVERLLRSKISRDAYVLENIKRMVPFQIRTMREERDWSQAQAGEAIGKPQNVISRLESPAYGKLTLQTLLEIAKGFDVGLLIKFVPFSRLVEEYEDLSPQALSARSVSDEKEVAKLRAWERIMGRTTSTAETTSLYFDESGVMSTPERKENVLSPFFTSPINTAPITVEDFKEANFELATSPFLTKKEAA